MSRDSRPDSVTLTYDNGQKKQIAIPQTAPVVTFAPATPADLKPGATVFVNAERGSDGTLTSGRVVVGNNGIVPPMWVSGWHAATKAPDTIQKQNSTVGKNCRKIRRR